MNTNITLNEINREAFNVLYKELGIVKTLRFLSQYTIGKGDYTQWKKQIYKGKKVDDLVKEINSTK
jgi:hypothetical protein